MNMEQAWKNFAETGRVEDYLLYWEAKNCTAEPPEELSEDGYEIQYGRINTDRKDNNGK